MEQGLGVAGGLPSKQGHKGSRQAGATPHNVIPALAWPPHVGQQVTQPLLRQAVQLWGGLQEQPAMQRQPSAHRLTSGC